jgi:hypothetical protein
MVKEADDYRKGLYKEGRRRLAGILGMTMLYGGAMALPFFNSLGSLLNMWPSGGDDDDDDKDIREDWENKFLRYMIEEGGGAASGLFAKMGMNKKDAEELGKATARAVARGPVSTIGDIALTDRVSLDPKNLFYRDGRYSPSSRSTVVEAGLANAGPTAGLITNWADAWQLAQKGDIQRAIEIAAPAIFAKPAVAWRLSKEGATTRQGAVVGGMDEDQFSNWNLAMEAIGFSTERRIEAQKSAIAAKNIEQQIVDKYNSLMDRLFFELRHGGVGSDGYDDALTDLKKFLAKYPTYTPERDLFDIFNDRMENIRKAEAIGAALSEKSFPYTRDKLIDATRPVERKNK